MRRWTFGLLLMAVAVAAGAVLWRLLPWRPPFPALGFLERRHAAYEARARQQFYRERPGEKPLNWKIAARADEFQRAEPMGKFVLHQNDCSDFVDAVIDDALGAQARFRRDSSKHVLMGKKGLWDTFCWDRQRPLLPGDVVSVAHSPHYAPRQGSVWHCGVIGTDGKVRDWTKLKTWDTSRYGRHPVEWFIQHTRARSEVIIWRLKPQYRYRLRPVPIS